jgi:hypothetical protein
MLLTASALPFICWPILDVVVVLLENKTENEAASNGIWIMCV